MVTKGKADKVAKKPARATTKTATDKPPRPTGRARHDEALALKLDKPLARLRVDLAIDLLGQMERPGMVVWLLSQGNPTLNLPACSDSQAWTYYKRALIEMEKDGAPVSSLKAMARATRRLAGIYKATLKSANPARAVAVTDRMQQLEGLPTPIKGADTIPIGVPHVTQAKDQRTAVLGKLEKLAAKSGRKGKA